MPAPEQRDRPTRAGLIAFGLVLMAGFFFVDSEWKGGRLQAVGGAALLAVPAALIVWGILSAPASRRARSVLRLLLLLAVLLSLAGIYSYGIFTTPWLLAPLWIAARRAGPRERYFWIVLAAPCALLVGWILSYRFEHRVEHLPTSVMILVLLLFWLTTRNSRELTATGPTEVH